MKDYICLLVLSYFLYIALRMEAGDQDKVIRATDVPSKYEAKDVPNIIKFAWHEIERTRRVTWRISLLGAAAFVGLLYLQDIAKENLWQAGLLAWIVISLTLSYRSYSVEDPLGKVVQLL